MGKGEILMVNIGSTAAGGRILGIKENDSAKIALTSPVCTQEGDKVALSRRIDKLASHRLGSDPEGADHQAYLLEVSPCSSARSVVAVCHTHTHTSIRRCHRRSAK